MLYIWTESRVHVHKLHEDDDDDEEKKKGTNENNMTHEDKGKNDETEVKSNSRSIKKANRNINGRDECDQYDPNLKKDENNIWKGRHRKLFQTSLTQIPTAVDNHNRLKKMDHVYRVKISRPWS